MSRQQDKTGIFPKAKYIITKIEERIARDDKQTK
jgi:hypothetical protein